MTPIQMASNGFTDRLGYPEWLKSIRPMCKE